MDSIRLIDKKDEFLLEINGTQIKNISEYRLNSKSDGLIKVELSLVFAHENVDVDVDL